MCCREAEPQRFCFFLHDRLFAGFLEPGTRAAYAFRYGRIGNRLLMLNPVDGAAWFHSIRTVRKSPRAHHRN